jgi:diapolycopene oxygenase
MERCGFTGLEESIETERWITPLDLQKLYKVNKGAIYGVVTRRGLTSAFKTGNRSPLPCLYFAGGSVNPGAGVPMVLMSGQIAANCVLEDIQAGIASNGQKVTT